jgi:hypothetical protein
LNAFFLSYDLRNSSGNFAIFTAIRSTVPAELLAVVVADDQRNEAHFDPNQRCDWSAVAKWLLTERQEGRGYHARP